MHWVINLKNLKNPMGMSNKESKNKRLETGSFLQKEQKTIYNVKQKDIEKFQEYLRKQNKK